MISSDVWKRETSDRYVQDAQTDAILDAAADCVAISGFSRCRIEDISQKSGISRATLYRRFGNRENIFHAMLLRGAKHYIAKAKVIAGGSGSLTDRIEELLFLAVSELDRHDWLRQMLNGGLNAPNFAIIERADRTVAEETLKPLLEAGRASGEITNDLETSIMLSWILRLTLQIGAEELLPGQARHRVRVLIMPTLGLRSPPDPTLEAVLDRLDRIERMLGLSAP